MERRVRLIVDMPTIWRIFVGHRFAFIACRGLAAPDVGLLRPRRVVVCVQGSGRVVSAAIMARNKRANSARRIQTPYTCRSLHGYGLAALLVWPT